MNRKYHWDLIFFSDWQGKQRLDYWCGYAPSFQVWTIWGTHQGTFNSLGWKICAWIRWFTLLQTHFSGGDVRYPNIFRFRWLLQSKSYQICSHCQYWRLPQVCDESFNPERNCLNLIRNYFWELKRILVNHNGVTEPFLETFNQQL